MKIRNEDLVPIWAERPDVFAVEPQHVQDQYREAVEAARREASRPAATFAFEFGVEDDASTTEE